MIKVCVFCSASNNIAGNYKESAFRLGELIAEKGDTLVYGGATGGLMTAVAEGASSKNGDIIGVIADPIIKMNRQSNLPTEIVTVKNLSERKQKMKEIADIFVVLPGGYGTLDEMFDVIASGTVGEHKKPMILVNEKGFFNHFIQQVRQMKEESCIPAEESYKLHIADDITGCMSLINTCKI